MYVSIKVYREATSDWKLKFWQKYWAVRSICLLVDYLLWPYLLGIDVFYLIKIGFYLCLSYFNLAEVIYDRVIVPVYSEIEPYMDIIVEHKTLSLYFTEWRGNFYNFFIEELEEFLVAF